MGQYFTNDENLKSEYRNIVYNYKEYTFNFTSDLGVFSKDRIDYASKLLIETYFENAKPERKILDVGCGYGFIGVTLSKITNSYVDMIDVNKRAIHLSNLNIKNNNANCNAFISNIYENIKDKYDVIISNPPIRAGKNVYMEIILKANEHLKENGEFWFVMNKDQGAKSTIEKIKDVYEVNVLNKSKGFFVILCKKR
ncbi:MAG: class I SAM-dependent methyltransferase [Bacilli bacterium]|nr:class I SAM-dependent methyltransferase [Bacilli bacterium]